MSGLFVDVTDRLDRVAWVSVGSFYAKNQTLQWRMPLALACVGPLLLLCGLPFVPGKDIAVCSSDHLPDFNCLIREPTLFLLGWP